MKVCPIKKVFDCMSGQKDLRLSIFSSVVSVQSQNRELYHDRDVQDAQLLLCRVVGGVFSGFWEVQAAVLVVDVEQKSAVLQPLLPPAHQRDVL